MKDNFDIHISFNKDGEIENIIFEEISENYSIIYEYGNKTITYVNLENNTIDRIEVNPLIVEEKFKQFEDIFFKTLEKIKNNINNNYL